MAKAKQLGFIGKSFIKPGDCFGGALLKGSNPKGPRPLDSKLPIHLVLRSATSSLRLPKTFKNVNETVARTAKKHGVRIYKYANIGNHLHILAKIPSVRAWPAFIRELTGRIAQEVRKVTAKENRGSNVANLDGFWLHRPFTRIVRSWRRPFKVAKDYIYLNWLESEGHISRKETKTLQDLRAIFSGSG